MLNLYFINIELEELQKEVSTASFVDDWSELVVTEEILEFLPVGHFSEVNCGQIFQIGLDSFHKSVELRF